LGVTERLKNLDLAGVSFVFGSVFTNTEENGWCPEEDSNLHASRR
jgi:hypothetical protein